MKYLVILTDGAGDEKIAVLGDKTPLQVAVMDTIDDLAKKGEIGMVSTIPTGMSPSSDVANLSVMGYDPAVYHTGRSPLEAANMGIDMDQTDVSFRCNLITVRGEGEYEDKTIVDHSSGDISSEEAKILIEAINDKFGNETIRFYPGVSYRHVMIVKNGSTDYDLTPPHDVLEQKVGPNMPKGEGVEFIRKMMKESYDILSEHPVNKAREAKGLNPANTIWIWGEGRKPALTPFADKYNLKGAAISAVDLIKGIAVCAGMEAIDVDGATGTKHTNYDGKAQAAIDAFERGTDYVYVHLEAPDECSHQGIWKAKSNACMI
jgi:2,3-bisphosphoglycerate-independent phosphoglycerate mutase